MIIDCGIYAYKMKLLMSLKLHLLWSIKKYLSDQTAREDHGDQITGYKLMRSKVRFAWVVWSP